LSIWLLLEVALVLAVVVAQEVSEQEQVHL
jgi:hypothetical protein